MKNNLETYIDDIIYDDLDKWCIPNISSYSESKTLYNYQINAIKNAIKTLYTFFADKNGTKEFYNYLKMNKIIENEYDLYKSDNKDKISMLKNNRFDFLSNYYNLSDNNILNGYQLFNRMCFWMATGSGKTIVIIKLIETIKYLQKQNLLPNYDILLLFPREELIYQFREQLEDYNKGKQTHLNLVNLKKYDEEKVQLSLFSQDNIYYYRSDLIRDKKTENYIDFKDYINDGKWFLFLDEAHRGEKENSLLQDYVSILSKKGMLFNFSATFTDNIDYLTTCYNFNLEKFITKGYGKNIYLNQSQFDFKKKNDDYTYDEKKKQVLKSLIVLTLAKKNKEKHKEYYHNPLLMTLVNSVNTKDSDLLLFFRKIEDIASNNLDNNLLEEAKIDLITDFTNHKKYLLGNESLQINLDEIRNITLNDIFYYVYNAETYGKIELIKGEKGKEYALKLETSSKPFGLIKIGDADKFQKEKLGDNYILIESYETHKSYFKEINQSDDINILIGSRSFYEGWDSNRPNVINLINIGGNEAKKFILQSVGRGIRIEPTKGLRTRFDINNINKNTILETLFIFATNKGAVKLIIEALDEQKDKTYTNISLNKNNNKFPLLIPEYKNNNLKKDLPLFNISENSYNNLYIYFKMHSKELFILKYKINKEIYNILNNSFNKKEKYYQFNNYFNYENIEVLLEKIINHLNTQDKIVYNIRELNDEISNYNNIKLSNLFKEEIDDFTKKINNVINYKESSVDILIKKLQNKEISEEEFKNNLNLKSKEMFKDLEIINNNNSYYNPIIYSNVENIDYIKNIINTDSETKFIKSFINYINQNKINFDYMFSKIVENIDNIYIPYFDNTLNKYKKFYPDFIFWLKKDNYYKIIFIDPKGTSYSDYQNKVDGFTKLFIDTNKEFNYEDYNVTFELKLITNDVNTVSKKYKEYWLNVEDFSWFNIE